MGRTTISCDDGKTWVGNHSWDIDGDPFVCGMKQSAVCNTGTCSYEVFGSCQQETCCGDTPDRSRSVVYGANVFAATWGHGPPGPIKKSTNGIDWTQTYAGTSTTGDYGDLVFGGGRFVATGRAPVWSTDGIHWTPGQAADFREKDGSIMWEVRRAGYLDYGAGGRVVAVAQGNSTDILVSSDGGNTWWRPQNIPSACAGDGIMDYGGIVSGNGIMVLVDYAGNACRTTDGGNTWSVAATGAAQIVSHGVWTGKEFWFWGDDAYLLRSSDGASWTKTPMTTPMRIEPVARNPVTGTLVAIADIWSGYAQQQFLRSTDGLSWEVLPKSAFVGSHPIHFMTFGYAEPSSVCPLR
jgi:hypothetical protein